MTTAGWHVGFVRSIMHGRDGVTGEWLRDEARRLGADEVETYHATGNLLLRARDGPTVCELLGPAVSARTGRDSSVVHRTAEHVVALDRAAADTRPPDGSSEHLCVLATSAIDEDRLRAALPETVGLLALLEGVDGVFWRAEHRGPHPHPIVEGVIGTAATARSVGTIAGIARRLADR